jgi:nitrite reductase (NO-forming)
LRWRNKCCAALRNTPGIEQRPQGRTIMMNRRNLLLSAAFLTVAMATPALAADEPKLPRQHVDLVAPPFVHPHEQATKAGPKIMEFTLKIEEKKIVIDNEGTTFQAMTFNGSMPGPLMVVHEGDYVEVTLVNPDTNSMPHNIDFHSATGALGGAELSLVNPGEQVTIRWKATRTGTFVYHCAPGGPMIPWHVVSGMNGAVMVLPREGLTDGKGKQLHYDKVFYIGEQDIYIPRDEKGKYKSYDSLGEAYTDTVEVMRKLVPTHVVFNGKVGALTGKNALTAKVGETVLIVHSEANRDSRPHLIGGHGDYVWETGKFSNAPQTTGPPRLNTVQHTHSACQRIAFSPATDHVFARRIDMLALNTGRVYLPGINRERRTVHA